MCSLYLKRTFEGLPGFTLEVAVFDFGGVGNSLFCAAFSFFGIGERFPALYDSARGPPTGLEWGRRRRFALICCRVGTRIPRGAGKVIRAESQSERKLLLF